MHVAFAHRMYACTVLQTCHDTLKDCATQCMVLGCKAFAWTVWRMLCHTQYVYG